ncbi:MAG: glycosyltransferase family 4 protein [Clostridia bacterium]
MRILLVNKFHYLNGGSEKYYFELGKLLKKNGNEVAYFSMRDDRNIKTGDKEYFVEKIDLNTGSKLKALDVIYSKENYKKMQEAIYDFKPDIVHLNNFQRQLSESIVECCKKNKIPMVFTAHDVQAICPAISMLDGEKNICEKCMNGKYLNCFKKKCIKNSTLKSLLGAYEGKYYRSKKVYIEKIGHIITPSVFYKNKFIEDGVKEDKIDAIHNFIDLEDYNLQVETDGYALYSGRLAKEKGILNLVEAFTNLIKNSKGNEKLNGIRLYIAGDGPERENIEKKIKDSKLENRIVLLGYLNQKDLREFTRKCSFLVIPSIWYENGPYSVIETQAIGKAIIGANIGGIPEMVQDNVNGLIYEYDDINELEDKMKKLFESPELVDYFGKSAKNFALKEYRPEKYYEKIEKIYKNVLGEI